MAQQMRSEKAVAVHVRFFSPIREVLGDKVIVDYYAEAIDLMETKIKNAHYYIFSTDLSAAKKLISLPDSRCTLVAHNSGDEYAYRDFWLMSQCEHFITANSTFSWWGAWLNKNRTKIVICPYFKCKLLWKDLGEGYHRV